MMMVIMMMIFMMTYMIMVMVHYAVGFGFGDCVKKKRYKMGFIEVTLMLSRLILLFSVVTMILILIFH